MLHLSRRRVLGPRPARERPWAARRPTLTILTLETTNLTEAPSAPRPARPARPIEVSRAEECLLLVARAIQQLHTYPTSSPLCQTALEAAHRALATLEPRDQLEFRVAPSRIMVDEIPVGRGSLVEVEIARRLHAAGIAQVTMERAASVRELTRFCLDLLACAEQRHANLMELLAEHGVSRIGVRRAYRPEVLGVGAPADPIVALVEAHRSRREEVLARDGSIKHLYPPDKGWVRLNPGLAAGGGVARGPGAPRRRPDIACIDARPADRR